MNTPSPQEVLEQAVKALERTRAIFDLDKAKGCFSAGFIICIGQALQSLRRLIDSMGKVPADLLAELEANAKAADANPELYRDAWECAMQCAINIAKRHLQAATLLPGKAEALKHLGDVLIMLAELHPGDQCRAYVEAIAYYNAQCPEERIIPTEGYSSRIVTTGPLDAILPGKGVGPDEQLWNSTDFLGALGRRLFERVRGKGDFSMVDLGIMARDAFAPFLPKRESTALPAPAVEAGKDDDCRAAYEAYHRLSNLLVPLETDSCHTWALWKAAWKHPRPLPTPPAAEQENSNEL